ncbi:MAG TPA: hypothetical protein VLM39_08780 [Ignavibacteriaceae bacterium]|nr:hypothetical protein [Ignavibacteriaceae bacterium]
MKSKHPQNPADFINEVEKFSGSKLNRKAELLLIVHEAEKNNKQSAFEDLIFTAKYIVGLMRITKSAAENPEVKNMDYMKKDFSANIQKVIALLKEILSSSEAPAITYFEQNYFVLKQEALFNMNELLSDLDWTKSYLNESIRKRMH